MPARIQRTYNQGYVTSRDREDLAPGEMQQATGIYYKPGDPKNAYKLGGRSTFGDTSTAVSIDGLALCQFDSGGTDYLLALSNSVLYSATPGATGTPASLYSPSTSPTTLDAAHQANKWYLAMGTENRVLKSDGTTRAMGMKAPSETLTLTANANDGTTLRPDANDSGWSDMADAYDTSYNTSAYTALAAAGSTAGVWSYTATSNTLTGRKVQVTWGVQGEGGWLGDWYGDSQSGNNLGAVITVKMEYSFNSGTDWTTIAQFTMNKPKVKQAVSIDIADSTDLQNNFQVRCTLTYTTGTKQVTFLVYDIRVVNSSGGSAGTNSATEMLFTYTEWDETNQIESEPAPVATITFTNKSSITATLPSAAVNSGATHWRIYRTPTLGSLAQLGLVETLDIGETTYVEDFSNFTVSDPLLQLLPYIEFVGQTSDSNTLATPIRIPRDGEPPNLSRITYFKGGLVGLSNVNPRALYYSVPGYPESWPSVYYIDNFPLPEHDTLVDVESIGGSLIIGASEAMIRLDEVPRSTAGVFIASPAEQIKGAPGVVGPQAMTAVEYGGISNVAWLSPENGILITDGDRFFPIGNEIDWSAFDGFDKSSWVLTYIRHIRALRLDYSATAGGTNDRYLLFHLDRNHVKADGQAKVTGPHYAAANVLALGQVSSTTRVYAGHVSDGKIYVEMDTSTGADSALTYNASGDWPLILQGGRLNGNWSAFQANDARLYHGDFGAGQTCTVAVQMGRDASGASSTKSKTVSLAGHQGTQLNISHGGEWLEETITHTGTGLSHIGSMTIRGLAQGDEGEVKSVA